MVIKLSRDLPLVWIWGNMWLQIPHIYIPYDDVDVKCENI